MKPSPTPLPRSRVLEQGCRYLVNRIGNGERFTPYSFMTAGACADEGLGDDEIVINSWLADSIAAKEGDRVSVAYYEVLPSNQFVSVPATSPSTKSFPSKA